MDEQVMPEKMGMSNTTLALLIILAIVLSVIGTWAVVNSMYPQAQESAGTTGTNSAEVNINIQQAPSTANSSDSGRVVLNIERP